MEMENNEFFKNKNILITGGSGFIGTYLVKRLVSYNANVTVVDNYRRSSKDRLSSLKSKINFLELDIKEISKYENQIGKLDSIFHLAAINGTKNFYTHSQEVLDVALRGTLEIFDLALKCEVEDIFIASSSEVYNQPSIIPTPEEIPAFIPDIWNPRFSYGGGKLAQELITANYYNDFFKRKIIFRPHNVYGQDMGDDHVIPSIINKIRIAQENKTDNISILGDGNQTRSFIYIDDFIDALILVYRKGITKNIYHIGTEEEISINYLIEVIQNNLKTELLVNKEKAPIGETVRRCPKISKLRKLGFMEKYNIESGIKKVLNS